MKQQDGNSTANGTVETGSQSQTTTMASRGRPSNISFHKKTIDDLLNRGPGYVNRPTLPDGFDYVEPTLANCAHRIIAGDDSFSNKKNSTVSIKAIQRRGDVYLGPKSAAGANAYDHLVLAGVTGIVNCTNRVPCYHRNEESGIKYCQVAVNDELGADILTYLMGATTFMHAVLSTESSVLVHCEMGVSRSATVVIAYLIRYLEMTRDEAYVEVKKRRPQINPNPGFWRQLQSFESLCRGQIPAIEPSSSTAQDMFDMEWATSSNALFATCRELPGVVEEADCFRNLSSVKNYDRVLFVALDFVWGRGVLHVDIDWLACVCRLLDGTHTMEGNKSAAEAVNAMLTSHDSEFTNIWSGEVYNHEIKRVLLGLTTDGGP